MTIKIFLGNLSSDTTPDKLRPLFEKYGEVVECDVLKNFGFVHMTNKGDANKAIAQLDGYNVDGKNIRVELSTGSGRGGGGGKDRRGNDGGRRNRPYGPPPGRGNPRDFDYYPPPRPFYDRYDPYYRYFMEREAFYSQDRLRGERDMYPPVPPRDRYPDPRDRLPPPRSYLDERSRPLPPSDSYFREGARPPPEYYERKGSMGAGGRGPEPLAAGAAAGRGSAAGSFNGLGNNSDYYRRTGGANLGGAAGGAGSGDYYRQNGSSGGFGRGNMGGGMGSGNKADSQSSFATDPIFF